MGQIGEVIKDKESKRNYYFAAIKNFQPFKEAVPFKNNGKYVETIPANRQSNYFRDGVREITFETYNRILNEAEIKESRETVLIAKGYDKDLESREEGGRKKRYTTYYERNPINRQKAIDIHGLNCMACGLNFQENYGDIGKGFIHVHHLKPISERNDTYIPDIKNDFAVLCPNCHAMIHRPEKGILTIKQLRAISRN